MWEVSLNNSLSLKIEIQNQNLDILNPDWIMSSRSIVPCRIIPHIGLIKNNWLKYKWLHATFTNIKKLFTNSLAEKPFWFKTQWTSQLTNLPMKIYHVLLLHTNLHKNWPCHTEKDWLNSNLFCIRRN